MKMNIICGHSDTISEHRRSPGNIPGSWRRVHIVASSHTDASRIAW